MKDQILRQIIKKGNPLPWEYSNKLRRRFPFFDSRHLKWFFQRRKNRFDSRETWDLHFTTLCLLYPRLKWYREHAGINFDFHSIKIKKEIKTFGEWIDIILSIWEERLRNEENEENNNKIAYSFLVYGEIFNYLWW